MKRYIPIILALVVATAICSQLIDKADPIYKERASLEKPTHWEGAKEARFNLLKDPSTGEIDQQAIYDIQRTLARMDRQSTAKNQDLEWISAGPNNTGGRTRAIITYQEDPSKVMIGGVSGGIFRSNNSGIQWELVEGFDDNVAVSSLARTSNGTLYAGTGHRYDTFTGNGLYHSTDDGATWSILEDFSPTTTFNTNAAWSEVNKLVADPVQSDKVWIAYGGGLGTYSESSGFELVLNANNFYCSALDISADGQRILAVVGNQVYLSTDGGASFEDRMSNDFGDIPTGNVGRVEVAISQDDSNYMYAIVVTSGSYLRGFYASTNGGETWYEIFGDSNSGTAEFSPFATFIGGQGIYDCALTVQPGNPERAIIGGIQLYDIQLNSSSNPPSGQWSLLNINFSDGPNPMYVHSDIHTFHWDANDVFYIGCDGGIFKSFNAAETFVSSNYDFRTTQFYGIDFANDGSIIGGTQDNGTHVIDGYNISNNDSDEVLGGDGFDCALSKYQSGLGFASIYFNDVYRTFDAGVTGINIVTEAEYPGPFWTVLALDESLDHDHMVPMTWGLEFLTLEDTITYQGNQYTLQDSIIIQTNDTLCYLGEEYTGGDTLIVNQLRYYLPPGGVHDYTLDNYNIILQYTNNTGENLYSDCDTVMVPSPAQSLFCNGGTNGAGFRITRDATKNTLSAGDISWASVSGISGTVTCFEFSPDGDHVYAGTSAGRVYRISGMRDAYTVEALQDAIATSTTLILSTSGTIIDMAVDQNNPNRLLVARPGYADIDHVMISETATTTTDANSFTSAWNPPAGLERMPVYSVTFDINNPDRILAGTEYGVWVSDDLGSSWEECNTNMGRVPVYTLVQQELTTEDLDMLPGENAVLNEGAIYAGTFGKGIYYIGDYILGLDDLEDNDSDISSMNLFPNPVADVAQVKIELSTSTKLRLDVYSVQGKLISSQSKGLQAKGERLYQLDARNLAEGTYILNVVTDASMQSTTFVVAK